MRGAHVDGLVEAEPGAPEPCVGCVGIVGEA